MNAKLLQKLLKLAQDQLQGDWVLIGGTVLPALGIDIRVTTDVDLIPLHAQSTNASVLALMKLAASLALPIESINQAGLYFLEKIPQFEKNLIVLAQGKKATIYRPNLELFIRLKKDRLSESDLNDCIALIDYTKKIKAFTKMTDLVKLLKKDLRTVSTDHLKIVRLKTLIKALTPN